MGNFNRGGKRFGDRYFDDRGEGPELFQATCSDCGDSCEVPFKPNGRKPVYCRDCFKNNPPDHSFDSDRRAKPRFEKPRFENAFRAPNESQQPNYKEDFDRLNFKMDMILKALHELS